MAILERISSNFSKNKGKRSLCDYLSEQLVTFLHVEGQKEALGAMADLLDKKGRLKGRESFLNAILSREKIVSTGIGVGVAIPHAKMDKYDDFFIAIGLQKEVGLEWGSIDHQPVQIIFMIGGPENQQTEYLRILSMLTAAIRDEERRKKLLSAKCLEEVVSIFKDL